MSDEDEQFLAVGRSARRNPDVVEVTLYGVEIHAQPEDLHEAVHPADDLDIAIRSPSREIAGAQLVHRPTQREVGRLFGVAEHDVRAGVHQFTRLAVVGVDTE